MTKSDFVLGGTAAMGAVVFTNPIDVVKTRMQLQGELAARGTYVKPYMHLPQAMLQIVLNDGLLALEKGLAPALCYQFVLNSVRQVHCKGHLLPSINIKIIELYTNIRGRFKQSLYKSGRKIMQC